MALSHVNGRIPTGTFVSSCFRAPEVPCLLSFQRPVWWFSSLDSVRESNILFPISFYFPLSQLRLVSITCNDINKKIK